MKPHDDEEILNVGKQMIRLTYCDIAEMRTIAWFEFFSIRLFKTCSTFTRSARVNNYGKDNYITDKKSFPNHCSESHKTINLNGKLRIFLHPEN